MVGTTVTENSAIDALHEIGSSIAAADPLNAVLDRVVQFVSTVVSCDSCFVYVLDGEDLVLRASMTPHQDVVGRLKLRMGEGITGWVAEHRQPVAVGQRSWEDPRFQTFNELPEDRYEAFLSVPVLSRGKLVGVINVQHREPHAHGRKEIQLISTLGFIVGAEIEMARLEEQNVELTEQLETRKVVDRAKGILQRDMGLSEEEAHLTIQRQSRQRRKSKKEIAEAIVLGDELRKIKGETGRQPFPPRAGLGNHRRRASVCPLPCNLLRFPLVKVITRADSGRPGRPFAGRWWSGRGRLRPELPWFSGCRCWPGGSSGGCGWRSTVCCGWRWPSRPGPTSGPSREQQGGRWRPV